MRGFARNYFSKIEQRFYEEIGEHSTLNVDTDTHECAR